jgi:hypothetical protein
MNKQIQECLMNYLFKMNYIQLNNLIKDNIQIIRKQNNYISKSIINKKNDLESLRIHLNYLKNTDNEIFYEMIVGRLNNTSNQTICIQMNIEDLIDSLTLDIQMRLYRLKQFFDFYDAIIYSEIKSIDLVNKLMEKLECLSTQVVFVKQHIIIFKKFI